MALSQLSGCCYICNTCVNAAHIDMSHDSVTLILSVEPMCYTASSVVCSKRVTVGQESVVHV
jgi:hypothetical protein